ncbi:unnamed protein product [Cyprideis torosa]|uniref:Uncharacterized protein n=1 Tax=Cyprideis torosa TaxID=163714 RepID=A0A7R8ZJD6_9CRUS|nr:unnamed protein product [Cyprideis torosa]CAG0879601.1 unnamed protein product [Cyprideis torosa]
MEHHTRNLLHIAAEKEDVETFMVLLKAGADINQLDGDGFTPLAKILHNIFPYTKADFVCWFLKRHARVNGTPRLPLVEAIKSENSRVMQILLEHGADPNDTPSERGIPLTPKELEEIAVSRLNIDPMNYGVFIKKTQEKLQRHFKMQGFIMLEMVWARQDITMLFLSGFVFFKEKRKELKFRLTNREQDEQEPENKNDFEVDLESILTEGHLSFCPVLSQAVAPSTTRVPSGEILMTDGGKKGSEGPMNVDPQSKDHSTQGHLSFCPVLSQAVAPSTTRVPSGEILIPDGERKEAKRRTYECGPQLRFNQRIFPHVKPSETSEGPHRSSSSLSDWPDVGGRSDVIPTDAATEAARSAHRIKAEHLRQKVDRFVCALSGEGIQGRKGGGLDGLLEHVNTGPFASGLHVLQRGCPQQICDAVQLKRNQPVNHLFNRRRRLEKNSPTEEFGEYAANAPDVNGGCVVFASHEDFGPPVVLSHDFLCHMVKDRLLLSTFETCVATERYCGFPKHWWQILTFNTQSEFTRRFPGLMSLCRIRAEWRYFKPEIKDAT